VASCRYRTSEESNFDKCGFADSNQRGSSDTEVLVVFEGSGDFPQIVPFWPCVEDGGDLGGF